MLNKDLARVLCRVSSNAKIEPEKERVPWQGSKDTTFVINHRVFLRTTPPTHPRDPEKLIVTQTKHDRGHVKPR